MASIPGTQVDKGALDVAVTVRPNWLGHMVRSKRIPARLLRKLIRARSTVGLMFIGGRYIGPVRLGGESFDG